MILQAMCFAPTGFTTSAIKIMTLFWFDDTTVALGQGLKAWITESLVETLAGFTATGDTVDLSERSQGDETADKRVQCHLLIADR